MPKIIDAHSHYMPPTVAEKTAFFKVGWSDIDRQLSLMDDCNIEKALLLYPTSDAHIHMGGWERLATLYNDELSNIILKHSDRFIGAGIIPYGVSKERLSGHLHALQDQPLKVLSIASSYDGIYLDDDYFFPVFECAQANDIPVHVHPQIMNPIGEERVRDPLLTPVLEYVFDVSVCIGKMMMSGTFLKFPRVKFIFAHYGGVLPFVHERFDNTYKMLRKREFVKDLSKLPGDYFRNLYFDISGTKSPGALQCALEVTDASHILFGSDFPANQNVPQSVAVVQNASISDEDKVGILRNAMLEAL